VWALALFVVADAYAQEAPSIGSSIDVQGFVTAYSGSMTAMGTQAHWGTLAADWRLYPPGTRIQIEGFSDDVFTVEDSGGGVHGNMFDIWFPDFPTAAAFGTKALRVTILGATDK
jgi:3D (Asp-Asp-Asp) domain-containing protein